MEVEAKDPRTGTHYQLRLLLVDTVGMGSEPGARLLSVLQQAIMRGMQLVRWGRHFYDPRKKFALPLYGLEIYPGYATSIRQYERGLMMSVELIHRVLYKDTCHQMMAEIRQQPGSYEKNVERTFIGMVVVSTYSEKTYRITGVEFNMTPASTFKQTDGTEITFLEYFLRTYNICIRDPSQPLLVSKPTARQRRHGLTDNLMLVPELSRWVGLTANMRQYPKLMDAVKDCVVLGPDKRIERLQEFNQRIRETPACRELLECWQLKIDDKLTDITCRVLEPETIILMTDGRGVSAGRSAAWNEAFVSNRMFLTFTLARWVVVCDIPATEAASMFVKQLLKSAKSIGFIINEPLYVYTRNISTAGFVDAVCQAAMLDPQLIMIVVPDDRPERYGAIKRKCCLHYAVPTQVIKMHTIRPHFGTYRSLGNVATKVAIQMNCKIGGIPWLTFSPFLRVMYIGFTVLRSRIDKSQAYGALVAMMHNLHSRKPTFFSVDDRVSTGESVYKCLADSLLKALQFYEIQHGPGEYPHHIIFYHDGVDHRQPEQGLKNVVATLKNTLRVVFDKTPYNPQLTVIGVDRRINTRVFRGYKNAQPGTIIDDHIILPERIDFYLVSQVPLHGTVTPTLYNVVHDESGLTMDQLQILTYRQTHLYYNRCFSLPIPAVCQYARKLAWFTAVHLHQSPLPKLNNVLYYL
ncbi:protein aubergine-like [Anopheles nili]|uniref:protein aubergine-like n=1 Tax=Anopheles nili TaxID=185578 RepID=UPI00237B8340|nr:protein aubergine-like [Anopheles nili]